jgi:hypothetical protein
MSVPADRGREAEPAGRDRVEQILCDYAAVRRSDTDPELEAVRAAILLEDAFGIVLTDAEIGPPVLAGFSALAALVTRLRGTV